MKTHPRHLARSIARAQAVIRGMKPSKAIKSTWREAPLTTPGQKYLYPKRRDSQGRIREGVDKNGNYIEGKK